MYELQVEEMSCGHCVSKVTKTVLEVDASAKVEVDLAQRKVRVQSDAALEDISEAISDAGYPVTASATV
ncbi:MAG: cation transporter [Burkholderiaceae bacterium]|uniref:Heavy-metal-associated domain-containing protein n=1 Tax=Herminiimonas contaminans TaxID=1111140 RepID=A0ABS0EXU4_9BURK|nr:MULTISPECIES: cation transporter [Oxalobacteraceae]MBF8177973.1 heavy-metal-associated domain-containing protein [Herminiimonas contaminans]MBX9798604.1 cation transporter [Burkholderiaceae bacterium]